ncbi:DUF742 domain-containing protein [Streptomyces endocoffeicus]|uniref:DUF742 domain-containing protein n=1 Tax=Streptomyces endocoffeicus TaxID=2898945 RepID=UPI0027DC2EEA|nr:DUF742 domain-containing protein [Streptomyces endocoffeicus]
MADRLSVRPYAVAGGRTHSPHSQDLNLDTVVEPGGGRPPDQGPPEAEQILRLCRSRRRSIAELSGTLRQPVPVVQVLVGDLLDAQALLIPASAYSNSPDDVRAVLEGLKRKWPDAAKSKAG